MDAAAAIRTVPTAPVAPREQALLEASLVRQGWRPITPPVALPPDVSFGVVATREAGAGAGRKLLLVHAFDGRREVRLSDLWRLVADMNTAGGHTAAMCLDADAQLSAQAAETAAFLRIPVLRVA